MKRAHALGFALIAALVFSVIGSAAAFAASPEFLDNGATIAAGSKIAADSEGTVTLTDLAAGVAVECTGTDSGIITGEKTATEEVVTATACTTVKGSCSSPLAAAVKLPWTFELKNGTTNPLLNALKETGWDVTCSGIISDTCTSAAGLPVLELLLPIEDPLHFEWPATPNEGIGNCSLGGSKQGDVAGLVFLLFTASGELLSIN